MTDHLKGSASYARTQNMGDYNSKRVEMTKEFYLDEEEYDAVLAELKFMVEKAIAAKAEVEEKP